MSYVRIKDIGKDISLTPIEIVMRNQTPDNTSEPNTNIIVKLHPTEGTHWVLVIRGEGGPSYYFDSFGEENPPLFLEECIDLGSKERIQQYDESYSGAYCLYIIYLIDIIERGFRIKNALNILVNQCKYPGIYIECFCLGCNVKDLRSNFANNVNNVNDKDNDNVNDNDNDNDNVKDNVNDNGNVNNNVNVKDNNNVIDNVNVNDNDLRSSFANNVNDNNNVYQGTCFTDDNFIYLFDVKHQKGKPNKNEYLRTVSFCGKRSS